MKQQFLKLPFKQNGKKKYPWIISLFPSDYTSYDFIEPFAHPANILLNKMPPIEPHIEVLNDIDIGIVQIFRVLRDEPEAFISRIKRLTCSERVFERTLAKFSEKNEDYFEHAVNEFIVRYMSRGGLKKSFGLEDDNWKNIPNSLHQIAERIKGVHILNKIGWKVVNAFDGEKVICYADSSGVGLEDHVKLSDELHRFKGKVLVSGCKSVLYDRLYEGWRCEENKKEAIWLNY